MPPKRYFDDESSAKPGTISQQLRKALDLPDDKLPLWIYKMRVLGYPPGWLQRADISNTSLQLFDGISEPIDQKKDEQAEYNPECLIEFPGFNTPVPEGVKDHCELYGWPPLLSFQQLNYCKLYIPPPKPVPYKRLKLSRQSSSSSPSKSNNNGVNRSPSSKSSKTGDDDIETLETENSCNNCYNRKEIDEKEGEASDEKEEGEASSDEDTPEIIVDKTSSTFDDSIQIISPTGGRMEESNISSMPTNEDKSESESVTPGKEEKSGEENSKSPSNLKLIAMGCPTPANIDHKKPPLEKFAVGMGELIYFENLPTSTGAFQKMRSVIHNVRKKLSE